ncbi:hypothetical protein D3C87_1930290 [compost metagenome]
MQRHGAGDLVQLRKARNPKILIEVKVAVVALRGTRIRAEENELCTIGQHDRVALQVYVGMLPRKGDDVLLENVRLSLGGRQKDLIASGGDRIEQRLACEVPRRADLAAL